MISQITEDMQPQAFKTLDEMGISLRPPFFLWEVLTIQTSTEQDLIAKWHLENYYDISE